MFGPPWGRDPFDFNAYLFRRSQNRGSHPERYPGSPPIPMPLPPPLLPYGMPHPRSFKPSYPKLPKLPKHTRFSPLSTPSTSDFSSSEWDDSCAVDTDTDFDTHRIPDIPSPRRRCSSRGPDVEKTAVKMPRKLARDMKSDEVLILPALVHVHIKIRLAHGDRKELRAAVPASMLFGDMTKQVIQCYLGDSVRSHEYTARVEQRGRMQKPPRETALKELAHRGEVYRDGQMEMKVEIIVDGDEGWLAFRERSGGRGPRRGASAEVETLKRREVSRTRFAHA